MFIATVVTSVVLAGVLAVSARLKLSHRDEVVATYARVGVPERRLDLLAVLLLVGAAEVLVGLVWAPVGIAAGACLTGYILLAIGAHIRHRGLAHVGPPISLTLFSVTALVLRTASWA